MEGESTACLVPPLFPHVASFLDVSLESICAPAFLLNVRTAPAERTEIVPFLKGPAVSGKRAGRNARP